MEDGRAQDLERRLKSVEQALASVSDRLERIEGARREAADRRSELLQVARERAAARSTEAPADAQEHVLRRVGDALTGEGAIGRIGAVLMVLGALYGVRYGIDRGWIVPVVRVAGAAVLGLTLLGLSFRTVRVRPRLSAVLAGAGLASLYVAVFAAQALYALIPYAAGLGLMSAVTVACLLLAEARKDVSVAWLAALGGLCTPFILRAETASFPGLVAYVTAVMAGVGIMVHRHGWRSLLVLSAVMSLPVAVITMEVFDDLDPIRWLDRWAFQAGILIALASFAWLPVHITRPGRALPPLPGWINQPAARFVVAALPGAMLFLGWAIEHAVWDFAATTWGLIGVVVIGLLTAWYEHLWRSDHHDAAISVRWAQAFVALGATIELLGGHGAVQLALASGLAWVLAFDAARRPARHPEAIAAVLWAIAVIWFAARMLGVEPSGVALLSEDGIGDMLALTFFWLGARGLVEGRLRDAVQVLALAGLLALTGREFTSAGGLTTAWSVIAIALLVVGYRTASFGARISGLAVLALVVGKLLIVDMARSEPMVRILLFLGIGGILLTMSYYFPTLFRKGEQSAGGS